MRLNNNACLFSLILEVHKRNADMMNQNTTSENVSEEDDLSMSKSVSKKRKPLPIPSEDSDSDNNPLALVVEDEGPENCRQSPSTLQLDDKETTLDNLLEENNNDNTNDIYLQIENRDGDPAGLGDGGSDDENMVTHQEQETSNSSAVLEDNGVYSFLSSTLILY